MIKFSTSLFLTIFLGVFICCSTTTAATQYTFTGSGTWSSKITSTGSGNPRIYTIAAGQTITLNVGVGNMDSLYIYGTLIFGNGKQITTSSSGVILVYAGGSISGGNASSGFDFNSGTDIYGPFNGSNKVFGPTYGKNNTGGTFQPLLLPIELANLTASTSSISWTTLHESNAHSFEVEVSTNGVDFITVSAIDAKNYSNGASYEAAYTYNAASYYIRLKAIDFDGTFAYSPVLHVTNNSTDSDLFYTAAVNGTFVLNGQMAADANCTLQIFSTNGSLLNTWTESFTANQNFSTALPIENLSNGMYILVIKNNASNQVITKRFVK